MRAPEKPDLKLFWLLLVLGLAIGGIGAALAWLDYASGRWVEERKGWVDGQALVYEVGIRWWYTSKGGSSYDATVHYILRVDGRDYEGNEIASGYSGSADYARSLILPFAPEAAAFNLDDLGLLNPQRTWQVMNLPAMARYDPNDPSHSQIVLAPPSASRAAPRWFTRGLTLILLLAGAVMWWCAWKVLRGNDSPKYEPPTGPELWEYPVADRTRLLQYVERVHTEILRLGASNFTDVMSYYADRIADMATEAREGNLMPVQYVGQSLGRGADEAFGDGRLVSAAFKLQECIDDLAARPPGSGRALSG